ncbi:MAG: PQQ-dependent sugar dehydrogenase [Actinomycetota bacterium]
MHRRRSLVRLLATTVSCVAIAAVAVPPAAARVAPAARGTIAARLVVGNLNDPAGFTFLPDGRIVYLERGTGQVRIYNPVTKSNQRFFTIPQVNGDGERGALGVAASPSWPSPRTLWVYVTRTAGGSLKNQILKITATGNRKTMQVLLSQPASTDPYHNGGRILFGPDGMLYAIIGEGHDSTNSQIVTAGNLRGKILRMTPDGKAPSDNPIPGSRIFAYGIRNSFGFTFDPQTRKLWETENGPECNDELNLIVAGGNYGWGPNENCQGSSPGDTNNSGPDPRIGPKLWFVSTLGLTGDAFCHGCGLGSSFEGQLFFGCVNDGILRRVALNSARDDVAGKAVTVLDSPGNAIYSMETAPDGTIYFSDPQAIYGLAPA